MSGLDRIIQAFQQMPRVIQWAALAVLGTALYLLWDSQIRPWSADLNKEADRIDARVREVRASENVVTKLRSRENADLVTAIGPVRPPAGTAEGSKSFNEVVLEVLQKNGASNPTFSSRSRGKLPKTALMEVTGGRNRVDRMTGDLKFEATPKAAAAIIAELESSPHVDAINSVRIARDAGGRVKVSLTIEAWLLSTAEGKGESA